MGSWLQFPFVKHVEINNRYIHMVVTFWVSALLVIKCSAPVDECTVSVFRVTDLVQVDNETCGGRKCFSYVGKLEGIWPIAALEG